MEQWGFCRKVLYLRYRMMKLKYYEIEVLGRIYKIIYYVCISKLSTFICIYCI